MRRKYLLTTRFRTAAVFEPDPLLLSARVISFWIACLIGTILFGYMATKMKSVREPLFLGYLTNLGGIIGFATIQPGQNVNPIILGALEGFGFGAILSQVIACVQITAPHAYLATATAVAVTLRAIGSIVFNSIYSAAVQSRLDDYIPSYIAKAAATAGLPVDSLSAFVEALATNQSDKLASIPGVTPSIITGCVHALQQAYADGLRVVPTIAAPFGALACVLCLFLTDLRKLMNYHVDAPVEELHAKGEKHMESRRLPETVVL
jgi:Fungal trichothecene efflux pump (TRI12)